MTLLDLNQTGPNTFPAVALKGFQTGSTGEVASNISFNKSDVFFGMTLFYNEEAIHGATYWLAACLLLEVALITGLSLDRDSLKEHVKLPILFLLPASIQFIFMPMITFAWMKIFHVKFIPAVSVLVTASLPGGLSAYVLAALVKGDQPLSGSMTFIFILLSFVSLPFNLFVYTSHWLLGAAAPHNDVMAYPRIIFLFLLLIIPIGVGVFSMKSSPNLMSKVNKVLQTLLLLTAMSIGSLTIFIYEKDFLRFMSWKLWIFCGIFPVVGWIFGSSMAFFFNFIAVTRRTVAVETMSLNGPLACGVLRLLFPVDTIRVFVIFPLVYSFIQFVEALLYVAIVRYKLRIEEEEKENAFFALGGVRVNRVKRISLHAIDKIRRSLTRSRSSDVSDHIPENHFNNDDDDQDVFMTTTTRNNLMQVAITEEEESGSSVKRKSSGSLRKKKKKNRASSLKASSSCSKSQFEDIDISKSD